MHAAIACIRLQWVLGERRRHDALRRHPTIACGEWAVYYSCLQGAARAKGLTGLLYRFRLPCQTTLDHRRATAFSGTLKHGRGQKSASTSPTREIGMACRPHTQDGEPDGTKPTIAVLIAVTDSSSSSVLLLRCLFSPRLASPTYSCH
jgi:hypothetical protein